MIRVARQTDHHVSAGVGGERQAILRFQSSVGKKGEWAMAQSGPGEEILYGGTKRPPSQCSLWKFCAESLGAVKDTEKKGGLELLHRVGIVERIPRSRGSLMPTPAQSPFSTSQPDGMSTDAIGTVVSRSRLWKGKSSSIPSGLNASEVPSKCYQTEGELLNPA